jgi:transposase-like protein
MKLKDIVAICKNEETCKKKFLEYRLKAGVVCKKCESKEHYFLKTKQQFKCKKCGFRTTLKSGTLLEKSKLPFSYWFLGIYYMTFTKKGMSALEVQQQLGAKRYEPIWLMMQKIRILMGSREAKYQLEGMVEMDEGFFAISDKRNGAPVGHARGSIKRKPVLVIAETRPGQVSKHRPSTSCRYFKMRVVDQTTQIGINYEAQKCLKKDVVVKTDAYYGYNKLKQVIKQHDPVKFNPKDASKELPWVHIAISNAKRNLLGVYHRINSNYLQNYLDEYCYRLNRRNIKDEMFPSFLSFAVTKPWYK